MASETVALDQPTVPEQLKEEVKEVKEIEQEIATPAKEIETPPKESLKAEGGSLIPLVTPETQEEKKEDVVTEPPAVEKEKKIDDVEEELKSEVKIDEREIESPVKEEEKRGDEEETPRVDDSQSVDVPLDESPAILVETKKAEEEEKPKEIDDLPAVIVPVAKPEEKIENKKIESPDLEEVVKTDIQEPPKSEDLPLVEKVKDKEIGIPTIEELKTIEAEEKQVPVESPTPADPLVEPEEKPEEKIVDPPLTEDATKSDDTPIVNVLDGTPIVYSDSIPQALPEIAEKEVEIPKSESPVKGPITVEAPAEESAEKEPIMVEALEESGEKEPFLVEVPEESTEKQPITVEAPAESAEKEPTRVEAPAESVESAESQSEPTTEVKDEITEPVPVPNEKISEQSEDTLVGEPTKDLESDVAKTKESSFEKALPNDVLKDETSTKEEPAKVEEAPIEPKEDGEMEENAEESTLPREKNGEAEKPFAGEKISKVLEPVTRTAEENVSKAEGEGKFSRVPAAKKQSNSIISKFKQSLVKAKKAIIGKSPNSKAPRSPSDEKGEDVTV